MRFQHPWPARSPDLNPLEHLWDILGRKIREITPPVQTLLELEAALHRKWQQISQQRILRLVQGMRRRLDATIAVQGGYIKYCSKVLKLIVFDSANFGRHSCSNLTSLVAYRTILVTICSFCQKNASKSIGLANQ